MKSKLLIKLVFIFIYLQAQICSQAQDNLLVNGSFETNGGSLYGWNTVPGYTPSVVTSGSPGADGNIFAAFRYNGGSISQTIGSLVRSNYYALSFSALSVEGANTLAVTVREDSKIRISATIALSAPFAYGDGFSGPFSTYYNTNWQTFTYIFQTQSFPPTIISFNYTNQVYVVPDQYGVPDIYYGAGGIDNVKIVSYTAPPTSAALTGGRIFNGSIILTGTNLNGGQNFHYAVLTSTNLTSSSNNWVILSTNSFNADGTFNFTNSINPASPATFFKVEAVP